MATAKYIIQNTFMVTGRGLVLAGYITEGTVHTGDFIEFTAFDRQRKRKIVGVDGLYKATPEKTNTNMGLLIQWADENEVEELRAWRPSDNVGIISKD